jgi:hypothetical protein
MRAWRDIVKDEKSTINDAILLDAVNQHLVAARSRPHYQYTCADRGRYRHFEPKRLAHDVDDLDTRDAAAPTG